MSRQGPCIELIDSMHHDKAVDPGWASDAAGPSEGASDIPYRFLLDAIRSGRLGAGTHLSAEETARKLGISRQPVRDAIRRLATEGLIELRPNRGAFIISHGPAEVTELFELRAVYEGLVARDAALSIDGAGLDRARRGLLALGQALSDIDRFIAAHDALHAIFREYCPKTRLKSECMRIQHATEPLLRLMLHHSPTAMDMTMAEHRALVEAIASGDPDHAEIAMRAHILDQDAAALLPGSDDRLRMVQR